jgi:hypothetical protein
VNAGSTTQVVPTPTPTATVAGVTSPPKPTSTAVVVGATSAPKPLVTLPPTDTIDGYGQSSGRLTLVIAGLTLLVAAGMVVAIQKRKFRAVRR